MVRLKTNLRERAGRKINLAIAGLVNFDKQGVIEVKRDVANRLLAIYSDLSEEGGEDIKKKSEEGEELNPSKEPDLAPQVEDASDSTELGAKESSEDSAEVSLKDKLESLTLAELKEYAKAYPKEMVKDLRLKQEFVDFLVSELTK